MFEPDEDDWLMIKIRVPATSANMGPGFDSLGIALNLYNYVSVEETDAGLSIEIADDTSRFLPIDSSNLVYRSMCEVFDATGIRPKGVRLVLENNIPVTRGLGSSSAGIVSGLCAGNALVGNPLSKDEILTMAARIEGHADNVTPAVMGGFTVNVTQKRKISYVKHSIKDDLRFAAIVPDFRLPTKKSRSLLPGFVSHRDAAYNAGHSALLTASLISGAYENIRPAINDRLHQTYRKRLIPEMDEIFRLCYQHGALGVYLSGAGPTIVAIIKESNKNFHAAMSGILAKRMHNRKIYMLEADNIGAVQVNEQKPVD